MKRLATASTLAIALATAPLSAQELQPQMDVTVIHQDAADSGIDILVPALAVLMVVLVLTVGDGNYMNAMISDESLKTDITQVGVTDEGIGIYEWRYVWDEQVYQGVIAQDVLQHRPDAVIQVGDYLAVDYDALGLEMIAIN